MKNLFAQRIWSLAQLWSYLVSSSVTIPMLLTCKRLSVIFRHMKTLRALPICHTLRPIYILKKQITCTRFCLLRFCEIPVASRIFRTIQCHFASRNMPYHQKKLSNKRCICGERLKPGFSDSDYKIGNLFTKSSVSVPDTPRSHENGDRNNSQIDIWLPSPPRHHHSFRHEYF